MPGQRVFGKSKKRRVIAALAIICVLLITGMGLLGYGYIHEKTERERLSNPAAVAKQANQALVTEVGRLVELPNEEPTVATVKDVAKLQNQTFFKNAQNGDKVLIFDGAKKAVLYRPSTNKVIEVSPVNVGETAPGS